MLDDTSVREQARLDFVLALRRRWGSELYPALVRSADRVAPGFREGSVDEALPLIHAQPQYPWFAWLERGAQKMMWRAVTDLVRAHDVSVPDAGDAAGELVLDPQLTPPHYYTEYDIHVQPGGLWDNEEAALVYEQGAKIVMMGENDDYAFHDLFARTAGPADTPRVIVDLGCGFGKSTRPFVGAFPDAEVIGIDLAAPVLRLAHAQAAERGLPIRFVQADAAATGLPDGSVDLVTATMLIHEIPPAGLEDVFTEIARILAPGGSMRILDFHPTGDAARDLAMREHGDRNNEPFMPMLFDTDVLTMCRDRGLDARWVAFDERGEGRLDELSWPERPEWHFPWAVLEAEKRP
jgi:ubiquinone/menaquinone biosynthesis C-methylase UbiE